MAAAAAGRFPIWFRNKAAEVGTDDGVAAGGRVPSVVAPPEAATAGCFPTCWFSNRTAAEVGTGDVVAAGGRVLSVVAPPEAAIADVVTAGDRVPSVVDRRWGTCRI